MAGSQHHQQHKHDLSHVLLHGVQVDGQCRRPPTLVLYFGPKFEAHSLDQAKTEIHKGTPPKKAKSRCHRLFNGLCQIHELVEVRAWVKLKSILPLKSLRWRWKNRLSSTHIRIWTRHRNHRHLASWRNIVARTLQMLANQPGVNLNARIHVDASHVDASGVKP